MNLNQCSALELVLCFWERAIDSDLFGVNEHPDAGAGDVRDSLGEIGVPTQAGGGEVGYKPVQRVGVVIFKVDDGHTSAGVSGSTPRVATYSARTERWRWPFGSMFFDGMGFLSYQYAPAAEDDGIGVKRPEVG